MSQQSVFNINVFTPKRECAELFAQAQLSGLPRLGDFPGWRGGRLFRSEDGEKLILIGEFDSIEAQQQFMASERLLKHRQTLIPLLDRSEAAFYRQIYSRP
jgi:heme-degrading monooxygenase HmoA